MKLSAIGKIARGLGIREHMMKGMMMVIMIQSNAACFHMNNAAQQGTSTAVDQHQWRWTPWGPYPVQQEEKDGIQSHSLWILIGQTKMTLTLTSRRVSVETFSVILSQTQIQIQSSQIFEIGSREAFEK